MKPSITEGRGRALAPAVWLGALALLITAAPAGAETYYVSPSGDDGNAGTEQAPFQTLAAGAAVLQPGDTLLVRAGTYEEEFYNGIPAGTSWDEPVTIAAYPDESVVIRPLAGAARVFTFSATDVHHIVIEGFDLDATNVTHDAIKITYGSSGASHHIRVRRCQVHGAPGQGILITGEEAAQGTDVTGNELIELEVYDNGTTDFDHGFYISTAGNLVEGCDVHDNAGWGIHVYNGTQSVAHDNVIRGNRVHENAAAGDRGVGIGIYSGSGTAAYNNLVWHNRIGIALNYGAAGARVLHNTVYANDGSGIQIGDGSTDTEVINNIVYASGGQALVDQGTSTSAEANLLDEDPLFVDEAAFDFHLQAASPAIDQGVALADVTTDFDGVARPQAAAADIGAFEYCPPPGCEPAHGGAGGGAGAGAMAGAGGAAGAGGGGASLAGSPTDDGGCGCRAARPDRRAAGSWLLVLATLWWCRRTRRP